MESSISKFTFKTYIRAIVFSACEILAVIYSAAWQPYSVRQWPRPARTFWMVASFFLHVTGRSPGSRTLNSAHTRAFHLLRHPGGGHSLHESTVRAAEQTACDPSLADFQCIPRDSAPSTNHPPSDVMRERLMSSPSSVRHWTTCTPASRMIALS